MRGKLTAAKIVACFSDFFQRSSLRLRLRNEIPKL